VENRILVVDDDEGVLASISKALRLEGYQVDVVNTARKAVECSKRTFYNLALIDIRLPDMEGTELLTAMKDTTPKMVKIILTGYPALPNAIAALNKGADGYLTKPVKMDELLKTIKEHLIKQSKQNEFDEEKVSEFIETRIKKLDADQNTKL
jgi:two-component system response regulator GlrR